jgi:hypothetical protein
MYTSMSCQGRDGAEVAVNGSGRIFENFGASFRILTYLRIPKEISHI